MNIEELINKYNLHIVTYNPYTKEKGEFIISRSYKKPTTKESDFIRNHKEEIIEKIKEIEKKKKEEKEEKQKEKEKKDREKYIINNENFEISLSFYGGTSIVGIPDVVIDYFSNKYEIETYEVNNLINKAQERNLIKFEQNWDEFLPTKINLKELEKILNKIYEEEKQKEKEKKEKKKALIERAKREGKRILVREYTTECNSNIECSVDIIKVYITPEGNYEEERIHSY